MSAELGDESALLLGRPRLVESPAVDGDDVGVTLVVIEIRDVPHGIARELGRQLIVPWPWCRAWGNHRVPSATDLVENRAQRRAALAWWLGIHGFSLAPRPAVEFASCADSSLSSPSPPSPPPRSLIPSPPATCRAWTASRSPSLRRRGTGWPSSSAPRTSRRTGAGPTSGWSTSTAAA